jgi:hypothetical protein
MEELAVAMGLDQTGTNELFDVVRNSRLGYGKLLPEPLTGTLALPADDLEHLHAPGIGQSFGNELEFLIGQPRLTGSGLFHSSMVIELSYGCQEGLPVRS